MKIMVTGGYGFIGSNFIRHLFENYGDAIGKVFNFDSITYAANPKELDDYIGENKLQTRYSHIKTDLCNKAQLEFMFKDLKPDFIFHFAAESHVCNSIKGPDVFYQTNVIGTMNLLEAVRKFAPTCRFLHVSTDEVFGELPLDSGQSFDELWPMSPNSPYAASKAASDLAVLAWVKTYQLNATIVNCSNNFGPNQHEEKFIPRIVKAIVDKKPVTIYGSGLQVRDWLHVDDCCDGIYKAAMFGTSGDRYCLGGDNLFRNLDIFDFVASACAQLAGRDLDIKFVKTNDRPTDDLKYALDNTKASFELDWKPLKSMFEERIKDTVEHYLIKWGAKL